MFADDETLQKTNKKSSLISYQNFTEEKNILVAILHLNYTPRLEINQLVPRDLSIHWFMEDCGIYFDAPACDLPPQHYGPIRATVNENMVCIFFLIIEISLIVDLIIYRFVSISFFEYIWKETISNLR